MRISIDNVGHVKSADIEVNSITVIAGNNNTGKSTVGKVLYAMATGLNSLEPLKIMNEKVESIQLKLNSLYNLVELDDKIRFWISEIDKFCMQQDFSEDSAIKNPEEFDKDFSSIVMSQLDNLFGSFVNIQDTETDSILTRLHQDLIKSLKRPINDNSFKLNIMQKAFETEFFQQISHLNNPNDSSRICVKELNQNEINIIFKEHTIVNEGTVLNLSRTFSKAIYIDNPFILDKQERLLYRFKSRIPSHTEALRQILMRREDNLFELNDRESKIDSIFNYVLNEGKISRHKGNHYFESSSFKTPLAFQNLSTGLKSFSIINILLKSKWLHECEYIILDEPEIHLHPDWQLKFAELVVLMSKEFNFKIIVTSHSPYFIEALELFAKYHNYYKSVKFYKTHEEENRFIIKDFTQNLSELYDDLANAFYVLEELRVELKYRKSGENKDENS